MPSDEVVCPCGNRAKCKGSSNVGQVVAEEMDERAVKVRIVQDDIWDNGPREWDNLGTMVCWHGHYKLGDEQPEQDVDSYMCEIGEFDWDLACERYVKKFGECGAEYYTREHTNYYNHLQSWVRDELFAAVEEKYVILPLYLYDHSGITMNTTGFHCPWDSGQVGWIYVSKEKLREEYGWKCITAKRRKQVEAYLRNEVETYDQFLTGDVYGFQILDEEDEVIDSCYGFYGHDWDQNGIKDHLPEHLQDHDQWETPW